MRVYSVDMKKRKKTPKETLPNEKKNIRKYFSVVIVGRFVGFRYIIEVLHGNRKMYETNIMTFSQAYG